MQGGKFDRMGVWGFAAEFGHELDVLMENAMRGEDKKQRLAGNFMMKEVLRARAAAGLHAEEKEGDVDDSDNSEENVEENVG